MAINETSENNNNVIGYNGSISLSSEGKASHETILKSSTSINSSLKTAEDTIYNIIKKYHPNYNGTDIYSYQGSVSLLLKDGTWDIVYTIPMDYNNTISVSDFTLHHENKDYARTTDGYLRCRITRTKDIFGTKNSVTTRYYALDYLPQMVVMAKSKVLDTFIDDYYTDVEISYKNIEGTTRIVVAQYDYGEEVPFQYSLSDIKSGKFTATVDKEYPTRFVITSYNKNGSTTSEEYVLNGILPIDNLELSFAYSNGLIHITSNSNRMNNDKLISSYTITPLSFLHQQSVEKTSALSSNSRIVDTNTISVAGLQKGIYILRVTDVFGKNHTFKFGIK